MGIFQPQKSRVYLSIQLLKKFTKKELEGLAYFVENKYFNTDKDLTGLLKNLKKYAINKDKFSSGIQFKVYKDVFGGISTGQKELDKKQKDYLTNKLNALLRLAEQFLMIDALKEKEQYKFDLLYPKLIDKKQIRLYNRHLNRDTKRLEAEKKQGVDYHTRQYKLQEIKLQYFFREGLITEENNFDELQYHLDIYYLLDKLNHYLVQVTIQSNLTDNASFDFSSFESIKPLLNLPQYSSHPLIQLYLLNIELVEKRDAAIFQKVLKNLNEQNEYIPHNYLKIFYSNLSNYCAIQITSGRVEYHNNAFEVYQVMHNNDLLLNNEFIDLKLLKNVITTSCIVKDFEWATKILEIYKMFIHESIRESAYNYNMGLIAFNQKKYAEAHSYFANVEKIDLTHEINVRVLLLKCIFEKEEYFNEATFQSILSTKVYFKRNSNLKDFEKKGYINFVTVLIELYKYKLKESNKSITDIKAKLDTMSYIKDQIWLSEKIIVLKEI